MVNIPKTLYLIRGEVKTNVLRTQPSTWKGHPVCRVDFKSRDGVVSRNYNTGDVLELSYRETSEGTFRFIDQNNRISFAFRIHLYGKGNVICAESKTGYLSYGFAKDLQIETSLLDSPYRNIFDYLSSISELSRIEDSDGSIISLRDRYASVRSVFSGSLLYHFCKPESFKNDRLSKNNSDCLIFPFGCNASQFEAVSNAMSYRLSVIKGPPGTGKTQTTLNILANALINNKSCLVVSNNNSAVDNVIEKLSSTKYNLQWLVAALGSKANRDAFIMSQTGSYPDFSSWETLSEAQIAQLRHRLIDNTKTIPVFFKNQERLSMLKEKYAGIMHQKQLYGSVHDSSAGLKARFVHVTSSKLYTLLLRIDTDIARKGKIGIVTKIRATYYGFHPQTIDRETIEIEARRLETREISKEIKTVETEIRAFKPFYEALVKDSLSYIRAVIKRRYVSKEQRPLFAEKDLFSNNAAHFISEYPIVTSTTFSSTSCIDQSIPFDYLIMDEASQVDIASGALSLNVTRAAVIVGDPQQLPNVMTKEDSAIANELFSKCKLPKAYNCSENSFLESLLILFPSAPIVLLREHYRCAPEIIGYCNQQFYNSELLIMTQRSAGPCPISVIRTVKGNHARGQSNEREAEEIVECVKNLSKQYNDIGVIAPYNQQVSLIAKRLTEAGLIDVTVATVHKFQGREKEAIILSTTSNQATSFIDDPHLLNVAVSRAKNCFVLVTTGNDITDGNIKDLIKYTNYCGGNVKEGCIRSVFDLLYSQYSQERATYISSRTSISQFETENFIYNLLKKIVSDTRWRRLGILFQYPLRLLVSNENLLTPEEKAYASRSWTLVDFLLYDTVCHNPVLVIEVDGMSFHKEGSDQWRRDRLKDSILEKSQIALLRLPTNMSREEERIVNALRNIYEAENIMRE